MQVRFYPLTTVVCSSSGIRSSYASQHSQLGQDLRSAMSPDRHIAPIFEERAFQGPLYRSPSHNQQGNLYRSTSGWFHVNYLLTVSRHVKETIWRQTTCKWHFSTLALSHDWFIKDDRCLSVNTLYIRRFDSKSSVSSRCIALLPWWLGWSNKTLKG